MICYENDVDYTFLTMLAHQILCNLSSTSLAKHAFQRSNRGLYVFKLKASKNIYNASPGETAQRERTKTHLS